MRKIKTIFLVITVLTGGILLQSCGDDDPSPNARIKLAVSTTSSNTSTHTGRVKTANDLQFTSGSIVIREVVFDGEQGTTSVSRTVEQIATIDYATGVVTPEVIVEVPGGSYTGVNLGIEMQDDGSDPSMVLEGTYTNSDNFVIPIRFEFNSGEVFEANASSVTMEAGADIIGRITFDALDWFSVISASQLDEATQTNGTIVISETSNPDIFGAVADRLDVGTQAVFQ